MSKAEAAKAAKLAAAALAEANAEQARSEETATVRVRALCVLAEDGNIYHPARTDRDGKGNLVKIAADEFDTTPSRASALGDSVEIVTPANPTK